MSLRTRVTAALVVTALALGIANWYAVSRVRHWHAIGLTGLTFFPEMTKGKQPPFKIFTPGRVFAVYPTGPAEKADIRTGDTLISINGVRTADNATLLANAAKLRAGDTVTYRVRRGEQTFDVRTRLVSPLRLPIFVAAIAIHALVGFAYLAIALLVLAKRPDDRRVTVFFAMMVVGAIYLLATPALSLDSSNVRGLFGEASGQGLMPFVVLMAVFIAFLPLTLHLSLIFPHERPVVRSSPQVFRWVYGIPAAQVMGLVLLGGIAMIAISFPKEAKSIDLQLNVFTAVLTLAGFAVAWRIARKGRVEGARNAFWRRPFQSIFFGIAAVLGLGRIADASGITWLRLVLAIVIGLTIVASIGSFPVLSCISLYRSYRDAGAEERRQVKWPLWGTISALATRIVIGVVLQTSVLWMMFSGRDSGTWLGVAQYVGIFTTLVYLLIPISFAVAILKYRLMNIDVIIRKTVLYALLSGFILGIYLGLVGVLGTLLVTYAGVKNQITTIGATLVVALLFVPLRNKLQTLVERNLFRQKYDYPEAIRAVGAEALLAGDAGAFLTSAAEKTQRALQNRAVVMFTRRHDDHVAAAKVGVSDSIVGALRVPAARMHPLLEAPFDPRRAAPEEVVAPLKRIEASLVVPINTPGTPANGFIALAPKLSGAAFDDEDIEFLRSMASQLDIGLDRIRQQREDVDYSQARDIQQGLLPREMPRIAGLDVSGIWQPARTMGGDYYDLLTLSDTELAVCIGDVAGKGMPAALLMSGLQAAVRASASSSPRDLCERVRRVVVSSLSGGRFVTFFYATIDTAAMRLRWTNAGHNAPILMRADGTMVRLEDGGPAISRLFRDTLYEEREVALAPGDTIVLFTDGVSEAADGAGEIFGEERIEELVRSAAGTSASELQQRIAQAATSFAGGEVEDDLTLVVVRVAAAR
jgi:serine phosphatase RsbU (regulator of sigma subunit)